MKQKMALLFFLAALALTACSSDPQWADPEAHEKTEQLREQYTPFIVGTWHYEKTLEKQRAFEQLTFNADGTLSGRRKWQARQVVTIDGQEQYTDWEDIPDMNGTFKVHGSSFGKEIAVAWAKTESFSMPYGMMKTTPL